MKLVPLLWVLLLGAPGAPAAADPRAELEALLNTQAAAWSRGDIVAFCSVYSDDALFLAPSGVTRGRQAVLERYQKRYPDAKAMGTLSFEFLEVRLLPAGGKGAATVAARWKLAYPDKEAATGLTLIVFGRDGEAWKILQDASM